jgi:hypothetical protein
MVSPAKTQVGKEEEIESGKIKEKILLGGTCHGNVSMPRSGTNNGPYGPR